MKHENKSNQRKPVELMMCLSVMLSYILLRCCYLVPGFFIVIFKTDFSLLE